MTIKTTANFAIPYPDKNEPPQISKHLADIANSIDLTFFNYQTLMNGKFDQLTTATNKAISDLTAKYKADWAAWYAPVDARLTAIQNALATQGWGTPTTIAGTLFTPASGWTLNTGSRGVKVGNVCAFTIKFQKAADPAIVAGASGNLPTPVTIGTLTAAMPTPTTYTPFTTMEDGYQIMGYVNPTKQVIISALAPNVNLPKLYPMTLGGIYLFNPTVP
jgi:roadblock/LC7 domain-containing protein